MAAIEESATSTRTPGAVPDAIISEPRVWSLAPIRERDPAPPDYSNAGLDIRVHGDPLADADAISTIVLADDDVRNGLKRASNSNGEPTLWAEPSPQTYDDAGVVSGSAGTPAINTLTSGAVTLTGVQAQHSITHPASEDFPLIVRPVLTVIGARFETALATLQAVVNTDLDGATLAVTRDLFYAYGGSNSIVWPAVTVNPGQSYSFEADLQFTNRDVLPAAADYAIAGAQVVFQITEYTSTS